jgi:type I restriction enzyme S subunit
MVADFFDTTIGDQITLQRGFDITRKVQQLGNVPVVSSSGISSFHDSAKVKGPGVVLGRKGSLGTVFFIDTDFWPHDTTLWVKDFKSNDPHFVYYFFKEMSGELKKMDVGAANPALNRNHVHPLRISWPQIDVQKSISSILGNLDQKIDLNRQINTTLEAMAQALFKSWFVDFDPVIDNALAAGNPIPEPLQARAEARKALGDQRKPLPAAIQHQFPDRFVLAEEMGWVPEGWEVASFGSKIELAYGKSLAVSVRVPGLIPVYGSGGATGFHNAALVKAPGIIVGRKGTVGSLYWVENDFFPIDTVFYVVNNSGLPLYWIYQALQLFDIKSMGEDSAVPGVNRNVIYSKKMVFPKLQAIEEYSKQVSAMTSRKRALDTANEALTTLRDTLLPKLLSGELRVLEAEATVASAPAAKATADFAG